MFLQIHYLTSYHATLLNRDDAGLAKRIKFGGHERLRVSSQCQKKHWRDWMSDRTEFPTGIRSRHFFARQIKSRLVDGGMNEETAAKLTLHLANGVLHAASSREALDPKTLEMKQPILFGRPEADYFISLIREAASQGEDAAAMAFLDEKIKQSRKNFQAMLKQNGLETPMAGLEGALFGRFVTSDILSRVDAPVHVSHAFTTHALDTEVDFFTVVDDLSGDETGAAHANDMELGAGIFYGYIAVDVPLLVSNLTGCDRQAWRNEDPRASRTALELLIQAIAQVSPGAKLGATAPYARAECIILETGDTQPRSLANAFLKPIDLHRSNVHPMQSCVESLGQYLDALEGMYGNTSEQRLIATLHSWPRNEPVLPLQEGIEKSLDAIFGDRP